MTEVNIRELEEALAPKKKGGKKTATKKEVKSSPKNDSIYYVDRKGEEVSPGGIKEGKTYYVKKGGEDGGNPKRGAGKEDKS